MFKTRTTEELHTQILGNIDNSYDKSVGSFIYDATKPVAMELEQAYQTMENILGKMSVNNLSGDELEQRVLELTGIRRKAARKATGTLEVRGRGSITSGDQFHTDENIYYQATEDVTVDGIAIVKIEAVEAGKLGNMPANKISKMVTTLQGIESVTNTKEVAGGYEAELDQNLRERYFEQKQSPATSGNSAQYKNWAKEVSGVGDAKVEPRFNGDNSVKVVIVDSDMNPAKTALINEVQEYIDPDSEGIGKGQAPIGAKCTVVSATAKYVRPYFTLEYEGNLNTVKENIKKEISRYLQQIAFTEKKVSIVKIGAAILDAKGVIDVREFKIYGGSSESAASETGDGKADITVGKYEVAVLGRMSVNE